MYLSDKFNCFLFNCYHGVIRFNDPWLLTQAILGILDVINHSACNTQYNDTNIDVIVTYVYQVEDKNRKKNKER